MVTSIGATTKRSKLLKNAANCKSGSPPGAFSGARPPALSALPTRRALTRSCRRVGDGLPLGGHGELVGPVVAGLVRPEGLRVPLDLPPSHLPMAPGRLQQPLPQVPIRHGLLAVVEPSVGPPPLVPAPPHAVDHVGRIGVDGHLVPLVYRLQGGAGRGQLHPEIGAIPLRAADLLGPTPPRQNGPVAPGATGSRRCPVRVGASLESLGPGQGRRPFCFCAGPPPAGRTACRPAHPHRP